MVKQLFAWTILISVALFSSCASDKEEFTSDGFAPVKKEMIFLNSLDSLNASYGVNTAQTRGFWNWAANTAMEATADKVGSIIGGWIGRGAGSAVGGPIGTIVGGKVGGVAGFQPHPIWPTLR